MANQKTPSPAPALAGHVAVVAGASYAGAGAANRAPWVKPEALVYCTGRSTDGHPSPYGRPETIDETAAMIQKEGGAAIAVRVDHTVESEVESLFGGSIASTVDWMSWSTASPAKSR